MQSSPLKFYILSFMLIFMSIPPGNPWSISNILFNWIYSQSHFQEQDEYYDICDTESCQKTGKILLQGMNKDVNPCDDFYEFTCSRWAISNPIPPKNSDWSCQKVSETNVKKRSLKILESESQLNAINPSKLLRLFFKHCMDSDSREKAGLLPIHNITKSIGGWPIIGNSSDSNGIKWQYVDQYYFKIMSTYSIYEITIESDYLNRGNNLIQITPAKFPRPELFPLSARWKGWPKEETPYTLLVRKVAENFLHDRGMNFTKEDFDNDIFDMLQFEHKLYEIQINATNSIKDMATIEELQQHYDSMAMLSESSHYKFDPTAKINWLETIREVFAPWNFTIDDTEKIFVPSWEFFPRLHRLLGATKNRAIVNYINWKFVMLMIPFTNDRMKELIHTGPGKIFTQTNESRRSDCLTEVRLADVLYREYAQKYFPRSEKLEVNNMAELIRQQAIQMIKNCHWLDVKTKTKIVEKIQDIHIMIGYPDWYDDNGTAMNNYYQGLIPGQSHFEDTLNNIKFVNDKSLAKFRQPMKKYEWFLQPLTLNGLYKYYYNSLLVTMAFAQSPIYSTDLPIAVKYGLLGSIIGHEIFHSIDPHGVGYDKDWKELVTPVNTKNKYKNKIECIVDQFNGQTFFEKDSMTKKTIEIQIRGNVTKTEDMADIEGIRAAFATYRANLKDNEPSRLIGLEEFNSDKLFFISYANKWCHTAKAKWWKDNYGNSKYDAHSPSRLRVNRPMSNFEEFAKIFNCPNGNKMNPQSKCVVFD